MKKIKARHASHTVELPSMPPRSKKTIEEIALERGWEPFDWDEMVGQGADLWDSNEEFKDFVDGIYQRRREARGK
jgi:hypothetical protein